LKRVRETSAAALRDVRADQPRREACVLDGLSRYRLTYRMDPTAYELLRVLQRDQPWLDVNGVRPRLTELEDAGRVRKGEKRLCTVTGKHVYTWAVAPPSRIVPTDESMTDTILVQSELFR